MIARMSLTGLFLILTTALAQAEKEYDPDAVNIVDAINCKLDAPQYMGFSVTLSDEDGGFKKEAGRNRNPTTYSCRNIGFRLRLKLPAIKPVPSCSAPMPCLRFSMLPIPPN